jgi:Zn-finger nucleic acid-binding protein
MPYEKSGVRIDKCTKCHGVWLSSEEFERIIKHLEAEVNAETARQFEAEAAKQLGQVFTGHEGPLSELRDLYSVLHLLRKRWAVEHPGLSESLDALSAGSPFK